MVRSRAFSYISYIRLSPAALACMAMASAWGADADQGLRQAYERALYSLENSGQGTYRGENPAQRLTFKFDGQGVRLSHPDGSVDFHLSGYGYGEQLRKPARAKVTGAGNRVEYQRGDFTEWYVNGSPGLEQGFTLAKRPGTGRDGEALTIALGVNGSLTPALKADSVVFESSIGVVLGYGGLKAVDARGRILPSRLEVRSGEIRLLVEDGDAEYPLVVDPTWVQQQELPAPDGAAFDTYGAAVAVSGDTAVIGAFGRNSMQGAAYVFLRSGGVWTWQQTLTGSDGASFDAFGTSVAMSGNTLIVGAQGKDSHTGAAYVFVLAGGVWSEQQKLTPSDAAPNEAFGFSVAVNGDTAVVGAYMKDVGVGAAYVFVRSSGVWSQQQKLTAVDIIVANPEFGFGVAVSGDTAVIGAFNMNGGRGAAYVFVRSGAVWTQQQKLIASDGVPGDSFGASVAVIGDTALIGAQGNSGIRGAAYVFVRSGVAWSLQQKLVASDGTGNERFGYSVALGTDTALIGSIQSLFYRGAAYWFVRSGTVWTQTQKLTASDGAWYDYFGSAVSLSGDTALIGAQGQNNTQGTSYVFVRAGLGTSTFLVGSAAGTNSDVLTYGGDWTATANDSFLHIAPGSASGTGNSLVVFTYDAFSGTGTRTGTLTIAGMTVTVTQAGTNYVPVSALTTLVSTGLNMPFGVAVDGAGNVYIADTVNSAIKEWNATTQAVSTLVSAGLTHPYAVAVDGSGNVYIADSGNSAIKEWSPTLLTVSTLVSSGLNLPYGLTVDGAGNVYIADTNNSAIKVWSASTQVVTTLVSSGLLRPFGVALDGLGNLYISDTFNHALKEWIASTQLVIPLIPSGLYPGHVASDGSANVYIADGGNYAIKEWSASTQLVSTLASSGLNVPNGVAVDGAGNVYIADTDNAAVKELPHAFVGPASVTESNAAGSDTLLQVLPSTISLAGIFAPTSDQGWLTIGTITSDVIGFSFTANATGSPRVAHISVLGQPITVTQMAAQTINFGALSNQALGVAPFAVSAIASSGLTVGFASTTPATCTVSVATVTLVSAGTCTIQATQPGNSSYAAATPVNQSFQVTLPQYLLTTQTNSAAMGTISPGSGMVNGGSTVSVDATANAGFIFTGFSGALSGATHPQNLTVNAPATVTANFQPGPTSLGGSFGAKSGPQSARVWTVNIGNNGPGAAMGAKVTAFTVQQTLGAACTPTVSSTMPVVAGDIAPGGTQPALVTVNFTGCASNAFFKVTANVSANNGAASGTILRMNQLQ